MTVLEKYLYQLRRIEQHREAAAEKEIRKIYKELLKEIQSYLADIYVSYSEDDKLTYGDLARVSMDARFLEEVEQRINSISPKVATQIQETVQLTYEACYDGMVNAVTKAAGNRELLKQAFSTVTAVTPDVIKAAVNNPVSGLTLKDTLEKHRKEIIYDIKRNIGVGLTNGDRYSTMARRISESVDGDYTKAIRIVRTEAHRVRESGFNDAATDINAALKNGKSGYVMAKTWHTMQDERVRPNTVYKTKKGLKKGKNSKYNHVKMDGVTIPQDELFKLPSGATCQAPSQTGVAGEDINCRCYLSYDLVLASELTKVQNGDKTIEEAAQVEKQLTPEEEYNKNKDAIKKTLREVEEERRILEYEVGTIINRKGEIINVTSGQEHSVSPPEDLLKDNIFTHNHPLGGCFSTGDIEAFVTSGVFEVRASTPQGTYFSVRRSGEVKEEIIKEFKDSTGFVKADEAITAALKSGILTEKEYRDKGFAIYTEYMSKLAVEFLEENAEKYGIVFTQGVIG